MTERPEPGLEYAETGWTGGKNPWVIAFVVTMATFMEVLDTSIANVSLPHIAGDLAVTQDESTWVLTSYLVSNAVILPISGWLATRFGRKRFYMTCVALFATSSLLCGIAPNLGSLIFFRVLQGMGGGGLAPSEQAILADTFPPVRRGMAMAMYGMAVVLAPAVGPTLGGYITDHYSWRWIFFINVPIGALSLFLSHRVVSDPPHLAQMKQRVGSVDYVGLGLVAVGLGGLEYVLDKGQENDWFASGSITAFALIAGAALVTFCVWEWRHPHPVVDVKMLRNRTFASANAMMLVLGVALYGSTVLLPLFEQSLLGWSSERAGLALSPGGFAVMALMPVVGALISRVDVRWLIGIGLACLSASLFFMASHLYTGIDFRTAWELRVFQSAGLAFLFVPINTLSYADVKPEKFNQVSGIMNVMRNLGGSVGIAFVTTLIARRSQMHQTYLGAHATRYSPGFAAGLQGLAAQLQHAGVTSVEAAHRALAVAYAQLQLQSAQLAYLDALRYLAIAVACMLPLLFVTRAPKPGAPAMGH